MIRKDLIYNKFKIYLPVFIILLLFFYLSIPENLSSADDAYTYSRLLRDSSISRLILPRYALFLPLARIGYDLLITLGFSPDAHTYLVWQSMVCASLTIILLFHFTRNYAGLPVWTAVGMAGLLLVSWAFWRYSVEAELYAPSMLLLMIFIISIFNLNKIQQITVYQYVIVAVSGALAVLYYKPNAIPVLLCLPLLMYTKGAGLRRPLILSGVTFFLTLSGFYLVSLLSPEFGFNDFVAGGTSLTSGKIISSAMVVIGNLVSFLWIFSVPGGPEKAVSIWPNKVLQEELYMQQALILPYWVMLLMLMTLFILVILQVFRNRDALRKVVRCVWWRVMICWIIAYSLMLLYFDPSSAEPWIMLLLPLVMLSGPVLAGDFSNFSRRLTGVLIIFIIFLINLTGGMLLIHDKTYDYIFQRGNDLGSKVTDNDIIMTFGPKHMEEYLAYHYPARVINLEENFGDGISVLENGYDAGRILLLDDVMGPAPAITYRMKEDTSLPARLVNDRYKLDTLVNRGQFSVYELRKQVK